MSEKLGTVKLNIIAAITVIEIGKISELTLIIFLKFFENLFVYTTSLAF